MAKRRNKSEERDVAVSRIDALLRSARVDPARAGRLGALALGVARKHQTGLTPAQKSQVCRKCARVRTSATSRVRIRAGRIVTSCTCNFIHRRPLGKSHA
jgi:RNase P subunit RPR2